MSLLQADNDWKKQSVADLSGSLRRGPLFLVLEIRLFAAVGMLAVAFVAGSRQCEGDGVGWADVRVKGPFICRANFSLDAVDGLLDELAGLQDDLVRYLGVRPASEYIELYLFDDQRTYKQYLRRHLSDVPYRRALYLKKNGPGIVLAFVSPELAVDLRHECTHALLHSSLPMVPLWLDEGLAEYFELPRERRYSDNPYLSTVRWNARLGVLPNLAKLEKKAGVEDMNGADYRNAWAWTHFMLHGSPEAHQELVAFLGDISASTPPGLMSQRLRQRVGDVEQELSAHFRRLKK